MKKLRHVPILLVGLLGLALIGCQPAARGPLATLRPATLSPSDRSVAPTRSPTPEPGAAIVKTFVDRVSDGAFSYRVALDGTASGAADTLTVEGGMDVSGSDYELAVDWTFPRESTYTVEVRRVGDKAWSRATGTRWQELKGFLDEDSNSPFAFVESTADVDYIGPVEVDDEELHNVRIADSQIVDPTHIPAVNLSAESTRRTTFEVLLDEDGRPVSGSWRLTGAGRVSGQLQEIVIRLELTFSDLGETIRIEEP